MVLDRMPASLAVETRKANPSNVWGRRGEENRIEPVTKPAFDVPFRLEPGEKIFTVGSCFARHVEYELGKRGFSLPMQDMFRTPAFEGIDTNVVSNFGTPSIYNEFAWAFGEKAFDEDYGFVEIRPDRWIDLHLVRSVRPGPLEEVRHRRTVLQESIRTLADCRVLIMTLGLVELWWDAESGDYLNETPLPSVLSKWPARFELHTLGFEDCLSYLEKALDIAFRKGPDDLQVILSVSPVPMMATHRPMDVVVANNYSKSVLRAVAEHVVFNHERMTYYPSYECVTHSDRQLAWMDDMVHVRQEMITLNVQRMVNAYSGTEESEIALLRSDMTKREEPQAILIIEDAKRARNGRDASFFEQNTDWLEKSEGFAKIYARFLNEAGKSEEALEILGKWEGRETQLLRAEIAQALGRYEEVIEATRPLCRKDIKGEIQWRLLMEAHAGRGEIDTVVDISKEWATIRPGSANHVLLVSARTLHSTKERQEALSCLDRIDDQFYDSFPRVKLYYARLKIETGDIDGAEILIESISSPDDHEQRVIAALRQKIERVPRKSEIEAS